MGGVDLKDMDPEALRSRIGVLFQDYASYELSVRENVMMGRPDGGGNDDQVLEALRNSRSEWLVKKMPNGLDSKVGRLFEGGHDLSGGEWQRLALARIMYRDADIWILDEPTSSLDPEAEAAIFAELKENLKGRIGIVISHRFSTVRIADRIAVIADGQVTELGTHDELLLRLRASLPPVCRLRRQGIVNQASQRIPFSWSAGKEEVTQHLMHTSRASNEQRGVRLEVAAHEDDNGKQCAAGDRRDGSRFKRGSRPRRDKRFRPTRSS